MQASGLGFEHMTCSDPGCRDPDSDAKHAVRLAMTEMNRTNLLKFMLRPKAIQRPEYLKNNLEPNSQIRCPLEHHRDLLKIQGKKRTDIFSVPVE